MAVPVSQGATFNATTAGYADVNSACALASDGDTVIVPSGTVSWSNTLVLSKDISLIGAGIGSTIITDVVSTATGGTIIQWTPNTSGKVWLTGFQFEGFSGQSNPNTGLIEFFGNCFMVRVSSNLWHNVNNRSIQWHGWNYGVCDHNVQYGQFKQFAEVWHDGYGGGQFGDASFGDPAFLGTTNAVYFEDNVFLERTASTPGVIDMMGGARCVVRFNTLSNCTWTTHGTESSGRERGVRVLEAYGNHLQENSGFSSTSGQYRSGTGIVCSNTYSGPDYFGGMTLTCYREITQFPSNWLAANGTNGYDLNDPSNPYDNGTHSGSAGATTLTDSTKSWAVNGWSTNIIWNVTKNLSARITANTATTITYDTQGPSVSGGTLLTFDPGDVYRVMSVWRAIDQPGAGICTNAFTAGSNPARPLSWLGQAIEPIYSWSNTLNGALGMNVGSSYPSVRSGREYFVNTISPTWSPLVYPHPLVTPPAPADPSIDVQPSNQTVTAPAAATFSVTASGTLPLTYQWNRNGSPIAGATTSSYTLTPTSTGDSGSTFNVDVTSGVPNTVRSSTVTLTVNGVTYQKTIGVGTLGKGTF